MSQREANKLANTVLYLLGNCKSRPGVVQLVKWLWHADYWHYRKHLRTITGVRYLALPMGPVPENYQALLDGLQQKGVVKSEEIEVFGVPNPKTEYEAVQEADEAQFTATELETLTQVMRELGGLSGKQLSRRTHMEGPWQMCWDKDDQRKEILPIAMRWIDNIPDENDLRLAKEHLAAVGV